MEKYITVDGGTTNTRLSLVIGENIIDTVKYSVGACTGCSDKEPIKQALRDGIASLASRNGIREEEISRIIASGMITSEGGLCDLPHLIAPVGIGELASSLYSAEFPEITSIPFLLVRGVKTTDKKDISLDMMRGEETELFGLSDNLEPDCVYILPGSHTKLIYVDSNTRICGIYTSLTGEMMNAVLSDTILKNSISFDTRGKVSSEYLLRGYSYAKENGVFAALFKVRVIDKQLFASPSECFSFFLGAMLQGDVDKAVDSSAKRVIIGGKQGLREPIAMLIKSISELTVTEIDDNACAYASTLGAIKIYRAYLEKTRIKGAEL